MAGAEKVAEEASLKKPTKTGVCLFAWRCLRYRADAAACNREGGGPFCGEWRRFNGHSLANPK